MPHTASSRRWRAGVCTLSPRNSLPIFHPTSIVPASSFSSIAHAFSRDTTTEWLDGAYFLFLPNCDDSRWLLCASATAAGLQAQRTSGGATACYALVASRRCARKQPFLAVQICFKTGMQERLRRTRIEWRPNGDAGDAEKYRPV